MIQNRGKEILLSKHTKLNLTFLIYHKVITLSSTRKADDFPASTTNDAEAGQNNRRLSQGAPANIQKTLNQDKTSDT